MIYCANNNTLYEQAKDACDDLGLDQASMSKHLAGDRKTVGSYVLARVDSSDKEQLADVRRWLLYSAFKIVLDVADTPIIYHGGDKI